MENGIPKVVEIPAAKLTWLRKNHGKHSYKEMAVIIGCSVDTLKRILVRESLQEFDGAKYALPRDADMKMWSRPCINCGNTKPRPKNHFFCQNCRKTLGYDE